MVPVHVYKKPALYRLAIVLKGLNGSPWSRDAGSAESKTLAFRETRGTVIACIAATVERLDRRLSRIETRILIIQTATAGAGESA